MYIDIPFVLLRNNCSTHARANHQGSGLVDLEKQQQLLAAMQKCETQSLWLNVLQEKVTQYEQAEKIARYNDWQYTSISVLYKGAYFKFLYFFGDFILLITYYGLLLLSYKRKFFLVFTLLVCA